MMLILLYILIPKGKKLAQDKKDNKNIILVSMIIGLFLIFMLGSAVYTTSKVMNCSSAKKLRDAC